MNVRKFVMLCVFDTVMHVKVLVLGRGIRRQTNIVKCKQPCRLFYILNMEKPRSVPWNILIDEYKFKKAVLGK